MTVVGNRRGLRAIANTTSNQRSHNVKALGHHRGPKQRTAASGYPSQPFEPLTGFVHRPEVLLERLFRSPETCFKIGQDVVERLKANREPDQTGEHTGCQLLFFCQLAMGG